MSKGEPLCLIGDSGTGKSHLLIGLGAAAAMAGHRVKYVLAAKLVEAADERQLSKTIARYGRVDLLCLDELGYRDRHRVLPPGARPRAASRPATQPLRPCLIGDLRRRPPATMER